jgi:hypothetical protein
MKKYIILIFIGLCMSVCLEAAPRHIFNHHTEKYYQNIIAKQIGGQTEVILPDQTRIDIVTPTEAIEVDFAHKWYEAIGQSSWYSLKTGKQPVIWLIKENASDDIAIQRCQELCNNGVGILQKDKWVKIKVNIFDGTKQFKEIK